MKPWVLAGVLLSALVASADPCMDRCTQGINRCSISCGASSGCAKRCTTQFDDCVGRCEKNLKPQIQSLPSKCPGANGKSIPCGEYFKTNTKPTQAQINNDKEIARQTKAHGGQVEP